MIPILVANAATNLWKLETTLLYLSRRRIIYNSLFVYLISFFSLQWKRGRKKKMLRVAARRLSSLSFSSPWWHNHAASAYVSRNAVVEDRRSAPSSHPLVPFRGYTLTILPFLWNRIIGSLIAEIVDWLWTSLGLKFLVNEIWFQAMSCVVYAVSVCCVKQIKNNERDEVQKAVIM